MKLSTTIICLISAIVTTTLKGFVFSVMWSWFVVTTFNLTPLNIPQSIGLMGLIRFITYQFIVAKDERTDREKIEAVIGYGYVYPIAVLGVAWIVNQFM